MWAYIATFNGKRIDKFIVSFDFLQSNVQWNINRQKFAYNHEEQGYTEGIVLFEANNLKTLYDDINRKTWRCRPNTFSPFPDKSIMRDVYYSHIEVKYELASRKCQILQTENDFLKQQIAWLLAPPQGYNYPLSVPKMGEENNLSHEEMYDVKLKDENIAIEEQFIQPIATNSIFFT